MEEAIKKEYLLRNIYAFNFAASKVSTNMGTFGTGYPFYAMITGFRGDLLEDEERPSINMWMICEDGSLASSQIQLTKSLAQCGLPTTESGTDFNQINEELTAGVMPKKFLPVKAHIIPYSRLVDLINEIKPEIIDAVDQNRKPYLPVHPKTYTSKGGWQYEEKAGNFVQLFLGSFTEFNLAPEVAEELAKARYTLCKKFSSTALYRILLATSDAEEKKKFDDEELSMAYSVRINSWNPKNKVLEYMDSVAKEKAEKTRD